MAAMGVSYANREREHNHFNDSYTCITGCNLLNISYQWSCSDAKGVKETKLNLKQPRV
jgi:hypothetical protein